MQYIYMISDIDINLYWRELFKHSVYLLSSWHHFYKRHYYVVFFMLISFIFYIWNLNFIFIFFISIDKYDLSYLKYIWVKTN